SDDRDLVDHRAVVGVDDDAAALVSHGATHHGGVRAEDDDPAPLHAADGREHPGVVLGGDQVHRALVEEGGDPMGRVARVLGAWGLGGGGGHRGLPKATATFAPPKPKELLSAAMSPDGRSRAVVGMSSSTCGSLSSRLIVGGLTRWWIARMVAIASSAPA